MKGAVMSKRKPPPVTDLRGWKKQHGIGNGSDPRRPFAAPVYKFQKKGEDAEIVTFEFEGDWPEAGIRKGDDCDIQLGPVSVGDFVVFRYCGFEVLSRLLARDKAGNITIIGSGNVKTHYAAGVCEIIGKLVKVRPPDEVTFTLKLK
jgi:hypothetical protein